ncbi:GNAT family N-acetyltransferase [Aliivibrio kagoshimensis]|uniref:GNAT family N-acetyltransferase n=1 Tax=Aliivibrio kagoshimensis TaxID=2910230 RepID=UPI003D0BB30B
MAMITIRSADILDLEQLNKLMYDLHHFHHQACPEHFKSADEISEEKNIALYLNEPECLLYIALEKTDEEGELIVGFVTGNFSELVSVVSKPVMMGSVDELYVIPRYRRQGIAEQLFDRIEQEFLDYGVKQLFVEVWDFNKSALHFYQSKQLSPHIHWLRKDLSE